MKRIYIVVLCLFSFHFSYAQNKLVVGCNNNGGSWKAQIKLLLPSSIISNNTVQLQRSDAALNNWQNIGAPVSKLTASKNLATNASASLKSYQGFMNRPTYSNPTDEDNALSIGGLMLLTDNEFATYAGCFFEDKSVKQGNSYTYRVIDEKGNTIATAATISINNTYLPIIQNLTIRQSGKTITATWQKSTAFYSYRIYRSTTATNLGESLTKDPILSGRQKGTASTAELFFNDTTAKENVQYYYSVVGIDVTNNESKPTAPIKIQILDYTPPPAVQQVQASISNGKPLISWQPVVAKDIASIHIYRNSTYDTAFKKVNPQPLNTMNKNFVDQTAEEGKAYNYMVVTQDAAGNKNYSKQTTLFFHDKTAPAIPQELKGTTAAGKINISWAPNKEQDLLGYFVFRSAQKDNKDFNLINAIPITSNSYEDTLPKSSRNHYTYKIVAIDKSYNKSEASKTITLQMPDVTPPAAPQQLEATQIDKAITLNWHNPTNNDANSFQIFKATDSSLQKFEPYQVSNTNSFIDKNIQPNTSVAYYVVAKDMANNSSIPSEIVYTTFKDSTPLAAAQRVEAIRNNTDSSIQLKWMAPANNQAYIGFIVLRKTVEEQGFTPVSDILTNTTNYADKTIEDNQQYQYIIRTCYKNKAYSNSAVVAVK